MDGQSLTVAGVIAAARYGASVALDQSPEVRERMAKSRDVLVGKVQANKSVYGISTGLGGSGACHSLIFHAFAQLKIHVITFWTVPHGLQRTRGRTTRSVSGTPSYSITTPVYCPPLRHSRVPFRHFRYLTRSPRRACPRRGSAARSLCASTRSYVATRLCAGNCWRRWSHCYVKTSLLAFHFAEVSRRRGVRLYSL